MRVCPRCNKSRHIKETIETQKGKSWLIESCTACNYHFDLTEYVKTANPKTKSFLKENHDR